MNLRPTLAFEQSYLYSQEMSSCSRAVPFGLFVPSSAGFDMQRFRFTAMLAAAGAATIVSASGAGAQLDSSVISAFRWRQVGPSNFMGRLVDVQGIPSPSKTMYGSA